MNTVEVLNALNAGEETTVEPADTPEVLVQATESALVQPVKVLQDQVMDSVTQAEEKMQTLVVSNFQLQERVRELEELLCEARRDDMESKSSMAKLEEKHQMEKANLTKQVAKLRETVQNVGNILSETHRKCDALTNEYEREKEANSILQKENNEMKETLMHKEGALMVSLAEAEEKHQKAEETITQLEVEKAKLTNQVETLRRTVQNMGKMLTETHRECDELTEEYDCEWKAHYMLKSVNEEMKETLMHKEVLLKKFQMEKDKMKQRLTHIKELMKCSLAKGEERHHNAMEAIGQLVVEKANLKHQVVTLQSILQNVGNMLGETHRECDALTNAYEREKEAKSTLQKENDEMKETLMQKEELLMVSLAEAEEKHQKAEETIAQLEVEKANLTNQVETLQSTQQNMGNMLTETQRECDELTDKYEREQEANSLLEAVNKEMKTVKALQMKNNEMMETLLEEELLKTPWQKLRSNTSRLIQRWRQRQRTMS